MNKQTSHYVNGYEYIVWHPTKQCSSFSLSFGGGGWMPGNYDSVSSALRGAECCQLDESRFIREIQQRVNHFKIGDRDITIDDMKGFK